MLAAVSGCELESAQNIIHSQGHSLKIPLDVASYKLYYVN
jgi:hypothetical protein